MAGRGVAPVRLFEQSGEPRAHVMSLVRKAAERNLRPSHRDGDSSRLVEYMDVRMREQSPMRKTRPLVIAGNDEDRSAEVRYSSERLVRLIGDARRDSRPIEDVAGMHD